MPEHSRVVFTMQGAIQVLWLLQLRNMNKLLEVVTRQWLIVQVCCTTTDTCPVQSAAGSHTVNQTSATLYRPVSASTIHSLAEWRLTTLHARLRRPKSWVWTGCWEIARWNWLTALRASAFQRMSYFCHTTGWRRINRTIFFCCPSFVYTISLFTDVLNMFLIVFALICCIIIIILLFLWGRNKCL